MSGVHKEDEGETTALIAKGTLFVLLFTCLYYLEIYKYVHGLALHLVIVSKERV